MCVVDTDAIIVKVDSCQSEDTRTKYTEETDTEEMDKPPSFPFQKRFERIRAMTAPNSQSAPPIIKRPNTTKTLQNPPTVIKKPTATKTASKTVNWLVQVQAIIF